MLRLKIQVKITDTATWLANRRPTPHSPVPIDCSYAPRSCRGRCQAAQPTPTATLASNGLSLVCRRGSANARQPGSSPNGPPYIAVPAKTPTSAVASAGQAAPPERVTAEPVNSATMAEPTALVTGNKSRATTSQPNRVHGGRMAGGLGFSPRPGAAGSLGRRGRNHVATAGRTVAANRPARAPTEAPVSSATRQELHSTQTDTSRTSPATTARHAAPPPRTRPVRPAKAMAAIAGP